MKPVTRDDLLDLQAYEVQRDEIRARIFEVKAPRRVHLGNVLTFLFENPATIRYQIQEMIRAERLVKPEDIRREIETYNEILGGDGELGVTLLIELEGGPTRAETLTAWLKLPEHLYVRLDDGTRVEATFDERQRDLERVSAVQFLKFDTKGRVPVAVGTEFEPLAGEVELGEETRAALARDLEA